MLSNVRYCPSACDPLCGTALAYAIDNAMCGTDIAMPPAGSSLKARLSPPSSRSPRTCLRAAQY
eukprot:2990161-Rhodomonas_salina.1